MRTTATILSATALVGLVAASPAPQQLDFDALNAAPAVQTAPILNGVSNQTVVFSSSAVAVSIAAQVTTVATASITGSSALAASTLAPAATANAKRDIQKRTTVSIWCAWFGIGCPAASSSSSSSAASTTSAASSTSTSSSSTSTSSSSSSSKISSSSSSILSTSSAVSSVTGSSTVKSSSGTVTSSSTTACPTTPENGTYCGFINPEDPCAPQPDGYGAKVTPDTASAFLAYAPFHALASAAPTVVPSANSANVSYLQTFRDLNASSSANSYIGLYTLTAYDPAQCAAKCDATALCTSFNIYIERDPSQNPTANDSSAATVWGYWCPNPTSITNFKCTLWGSNLDATTATNQGDWREQFQVVVTASNGYDATNYTVPISVVNPVVSTASSAVSAVAAATSVVSASAVASATATAAAIWSAPKNCSSKAINAPSYFMGSKYYTGAFNPQLCADFAVAQNAVNKAAAVAAGKTTFTPCQMFNSYYLHKNGVPHGTYCALYDSQLSTSWATYSGGVSSSGDKYSCKQSWTYQLNTPNSGKC